MTFGQVLANHRKQKFLTQRNIAEAMNVSLSEIVDLERDIADPRTFGKLNELASVVGISSEQLQALARNHHEHSAFRRKLDADEEFSMLAFRRSQE